MVSNSAVEFPALQDHYPIAHLVFHQLLPEGRMAVVDAGASGGGEFFRWGMLGRHLSLYGFEPDEAECRRLQALAASGQASVRYSAECLGRTEKSRPLYVAHSRFNMWLLPINQARYRRKKAFVNGRKIRQSDTFVTERELRIDSINLDDWSTRESVSDVDYLKIDIEGTELELLEASPRTLEKAVGVSVDVIFHEDWIGAPVFSDIDVFMRQHGFSLYELRGLKRNFQYDSPIELRNEDGELMGQVACADAIYLRDFFEYPEFPLGFEKTLKLVVAAEINGQVDYAFELLHHLRRTADTIDSRRTLDDIIALATQAYERRAAMMVGYQRVKGLENAMRALLPQSSWALLRPIARRMRLLFGSAKQ